MRTDKKPGKAKMAGWGIYVTLTQTRHPTDVVTRAAGAESLDAIRILYAHLDEVAPGLENRGRAVMPGEIIGYTDITGNAQADRPHLHFEIRNPRLATNQSVSRERGIVDPAQYFVRPTMVVETLGSRPLPIQEWSDQPGVDWLLDPKSREPTIEAFPTRNALK